MTRSLTQVSVAAVPLLASPGMSHQQAKADFEARWDLWLVGERRQHGRAVQKRLWVLLTGVALGVIAVAALVINGGAK